MNCSSCHVDIDAVEVITRRAKSGPRSGQEYQAKVCASCGTFNFMNDAGTSKGLDNFSVETLKRLENKVDQMLLIIRKLGGEEATGDQKVQQGPNGESVINPEDIPWEE